MRTKTRNTLIKLADVLEHFADRDLVASLEVVLSHLTKQPRRSSRTITRKPKRSAVRPIVYRIYNQRVVVRG